MFCKACGKEITDDSVYCSYCGTNQLVDKAEAEKSEKTEPGNPGKIKKLAKFGNVALPVAKGILGPVVKPLIDPALSKAKKSFAKELDKKVDQALKAKGWKSKTIGDYGKDFLKKAKKIK